VAAGHSPLCLRFRCTNTPTDGLNTQNRWTSTQDDIDTRQATTCANIKLANVELYTIQVNTGGDPTSTMLQTCASSTDKFYLLTAADQMTATFNTDRHQPDQVARRSVTAITGQRWQNKKPGSL